jgi:DNA-directed RNA polymerase specialized sigma24 family protein
MSRNFTSEQVLVDQLVASDTEAFEEIHRRYCFPLYTYCIGKLHAPADARRIVRDIFIRLWERRQQLPIDFSLQVHLYGEIRRGVLDCVNEKLINEDDLSLIHAQVIPAFKTQRLKDARQPVINKRTPPCEYQGGEMRKQPWWNQYPSFLKGRGMKLALERVLHIF